MPSSPYFMLSHLFLLLTILMTCANILQAQDQSENQQYTREHLLQQVYQSDYDQIFKIRGEMSEDQIKAIEKALYTSDIDVKLKIDRDDKGAIRYCKITLKQSSCAADNFDGAVILKTKDGKTACSIKSRG